MVNNPKNTREGMLSMIISEAFFPLSDDVDFSAHVSDNDLGEKVGMDMGLREKYTRMRRMTIIF